MNFKNSKCHFFFMAIVLVAVLCELTACGDETSRLKRNLEDAQKAMAVGDYSRAQYIFYQLKQQYPDEQKIRLGLGYCYLKQNHDEYAGGEFSKVLTLSVQTNGLAWLGLGSYYQRLRKLPDAEICYANATVCMPENVEAYSNLGTVRYKQGKYQTAIEAYDKALQLGDTRGDVYAVIGLCHQRVKNWREAVRYLEKARMALPENRKIPLQLAYIYKENFDDPVKAAENFKLYEALDPQGARSLASAFAEPEKITPSDNQPDTKLQPKEGASVVIAPPTPQQPKQEEPQLTGIKEDPKKSQADALEHNGRLKRLEGDPRSAIKAYEQALALDNKRGYLYGEIGDIYSGEFNDEELLSALKNYKAYATWCQKDLTTFAAVNQKIKDVQNRYNLAEAKLRDIREKEAKAREQAQQAEAQRQQALAQDVQAKMERTQSYDQLLAEGAKQIAAGNAAEAQTALQKAVAFNENDYRAYHQLGLCMVQQISGKSAAGINKAKCDEAIMYFSMAIEKKADYANSYAMRGTVYDMLGRKEEAIADYSYYLEIIEDDGTRMAQRITNRYQDLAGAR